MRRKGVPCACDPCKGKNYVRAVNNVSPDPNGDLIIRGGNGIEVIQSGDDLVINNTANPNAFIAGNNIELNPSGDDISIDLAEEPVVDGLTVNGDTQLNGDLEVNGDIIQNGSAYETHAEHVFTKDDYIIMRDGAVSGLPQGDYSGFQVKLYDGVDDGRLVIDREGTARVGDVGDEQPLLTRDEAADLTDGHLLEWDAANSKAVDSGTDVSAINTAINGKVSGTGNIGSDTKPIKIVNGAAVEVSDALQTELVVTSGTGSMASGLTGVINWRKYGKTVFISLTGITGLVANRNDQLVATGVPPSTFGLQNFILSTPNATVFALFYVDLNGRVYANTNNTGSFYGNATYLG